MPLLFVIYSIKSKTSIAEKKAKVKEGLCWKEMALYLKIIEKINLAMFTN